MADLGMRIREGSGGAKRVELQCEHQNGLIYVVSAEGNWVCTDDLIHAHALAGFFKEMTDLGDERIRTLMQKWGIYYRSRDVITQDPESDSDPIELSS